MPGTQGKLPNWVTSREPTWKTNGNSKLTRLHGQGRTGRLWLSCTSPKDPLVASQRSPAQSWECEMPRARLLCRVGRPAAPCHTADRLCFHDSFYPLRCPGRRPGRPAVFSLAFPMLCPLPGAVCLLMPAYLLLILPYQLKSAAQEVFSGNYPTAPLTGECKELQEHKWSASPSGCLKDRDYILFHTLTSDQDWPSRRARLNNSSLLLPLSPSP